MVASHRRWFLINLILMIQFQFVIYCSKETLFYSNWKQICTPHRHAWSGLLTGNDLKFNTIWVNGFWLNFSLIIKIQFFSRGIINWECANLGHIKFYRKLVRLLTNWYYQKTQKSIMSFMFQFSSFMWVDLPAAILQCLLWQWNRVLDLFFNLGSYYNNLSQLSNC